MNNFTELERRCQATFLSCPEAYHAYTSGKEMPIVFTTTDELAFVMNAVAFAAFTHAHSIKIVTFAVMNNHFHFVALGARSGIEAFFLCLIKKIRRYIPAAGDMKLSFKAITDLAGMRNNIVYTNRNGYVANPDHTPFSYPWGAGKYYFNAIQANQTYNDISFDQKRSMLKGRVTRFPDDWRVTDGYISPESFCIIDLGMAMFRDAHQYFASISKNVEAYSGMAMKLDDGEFLTDQELYAQIVKMVREKYHLTSLRELSRAQRLDLARTLHYDYRSSNGQIRRMLGLSEYEANSLFPLSQKT